MAARRKTAPVKRNPGAGAKQAPAPAPPKQPQWMVPTDKGMVPESELRGR